MTRRIVGTVIQCFPFIFRTLTLRACCNEKKKHTHTKKRLSSFCHLQDKKNSWQENKNLTPVLWITFVSRFFFVRKNGCGWRRFLRARRRTLFITSFREKSFLDWLMEQHLNDYKSNSNILWQILFTHFSVRFFL